VHRRIRLIQFADDAGGGGGPDEGLGVGVMIVEVVVDGGLEVDDRAEDTAFEAPAAHRREEAFDGVEPRSRGGREVEDPAWVSGEPGLHLGMLVDGVIVQDDVDHLAGRNCALDGVEEADEFLMAVALHAAAEDGAVEDVQRGEQGCRAVADIIVGHRTGLARLDRQSRLRPIERLDLAFLVDRQHDGMPRRVHIEADDVLELGDEVRVLRALVGADAVRLEPVPRPDALHRAQGERRRLGHRSPGPVGGLAGRLTAGQGHHMADRRRRRRRLAGRSRLVPKDTVHALLGVALLPAPYRRSADPGPPRHLGDIAPVGRMQDNAGPGRMFLRPVAIGHDRGQPRAILRRNPRTNRLCHHQRIAQLAPDVSLPNASVH